MLQFGYAVVDGTPCPISDMRFSDGAIRVTLVRHGPAPAVISPITFFSGDGAGCFQTGPIEFDAMGEYVRQEIAYVLRVTEITNEQVTL